VISHDFGEVIAELVGIALLRQLTLEVVTNGETASNADERHAFAIRTEGRSDADPRIACNHAGRIAGTGKAKCCRRATTGIGDQIGPLGMQKGALGFPEISHTGFIDGRRADGPDVREVDLLRASSVVVAESGQKIWRGRLKSGKRLPVEGIVEIIVEIKILFVINPVVYFYCELVRVRVLIGNRAKKIIDIAWVRSTGIGVGTGHEVLQYGHSRRVETVGGNHVGGKE
jgi:hypothetical protein